LPPSVSSETYRKRQKRLARIETSAVVVSVIILSLFDLVELSTFNQILQANNLFVLFHELHDILALLIIFIFAEKRDPQKALNVAMVFVFLHVPYIIIQHKERPLEMVRLMAINSGALYAVTVLKNKAFLENQLKELSIKDSLTGLYNSRHFHELFRRELLLSKRESRTGALLYLDIDRFKSVNDRFGHQIGDQLLREIAAILLSTCRETDIVGRLGGDEFVVIMPDVDQKGAAVIATRLLLEASESKKTAQFGGLGLSMGISFYPSDSLDTKELICFADEAMYRAKSQGGNKFVYYADHTI
jgi:diguanylate cyclase (GGDEF)-like protein